MYGRIWLDLRECLVTCTEKNGNFISAEGEFHLPICFCEHTGHPIVREYFVGWASTLAPNDKISVLNVLSPITG
jgi:hypothetical protein